MADHSKKGKKK